MKHELITVIRQYRDRERAKCKFFDYTLRGIALNRLCDQIIDEKDFLKLIGRALSHNHNQLHEDMLNLLFEKVLVVH